MLLELLLAVVILATCLVALGAVISQGIGEAADSISQRAAREACRAKLEEVVANGDASGGGQIDGHPGLQWSLTREEHTAGAIESPDEKYDIVTVTVTFTTDTGSQQVKLATMTDPPDLVATQQQGTQKR
jgi:hypothetical protein